MNAACIIDGCGRPAAPRRQWCWGHYWRHRHGLPLDAPLAPRKQSPLSVLREALASYYEVDPLDTEEHTRRWKRLRVAMRRWALAPKPHDPRRRGGEAAE